MKNRIKLGLFMGAVLFATSCSLDQDPISEFSEITEKFQISWSSLIISNGEKKIDLTDFAFANALKSPELLRSELEKTIDSLL